jgi:hypothetical protein
MIQNFGRKNDLYQLGNTVNLNIYITYRYCNFFRHISNFVLSNNLLHVLTVFITKKNLSDVTFVGHKSMSFLRISYNSPLILNDREQFVFELRSLMYNIYFTNEYYIYRNKWTENEQQIHTKQFDLTYLFTKQWISGASSMNFLYWLKSKFWNFYF